MTTTERIETLLAQAANPPKSASEQDISNWRTEAGELYLAEFLRRMAGMDWTRWTLYRQGQMFPEIGLRLRAQHGALPAEADESQLSALQRMFDRMYANTTGPDTDRYLRNRPRT